MTGNIMSELEALFSRTETAVINFMEILKPKIEVAHDEYEKLHWHHIYEEEEQRLDRLKDLIPRVNFYVNNSDGQTTNNLEFIHLLQDISLEKFGLHNFEEHIDLALFKSDSQEQEDLLRSMRQLTEQDYEKIKELLTALNEQYNGAASRAGSIPIDEKEHAENSVKLDKFVSRETNSVEYIKSVTETTKRLTVGSLKQT
ncbi:IMEF encapsulin system ferritin-like cargo protein [Bacillus sp. Marseille-P3661]|uniref:IMEF encapsulin system ferritin-like cargo protein n=1 Tax=Bacillus sp. Marseille-P3661 TaxID=1936234 RepID=UPI000C828727|nr:IMEF encapsulin system ferritin-like cargo protein [Bacillus sp. Marseille-P3661]